MNGKQWILASVAVAFAFVFGAHTMEGGSSAPPVTFSMNPSGAVETYAPHGIDVNNPFFRPLGHNGRACASCHSPADGFTITPAKVQQRFASTNGTDPIFRASDGAVCPTADVSTPSKRKNAYALLLTKGLIRMHRAIPANADFQLVSIDDPYHCATAKNLSLYRRPLPTTNLRFLSSVTWDARESGHAGRDITGDLNAQATAAVVEHEQPSTAPSASVIKQIVAFEQSLTTAQAVDFRAGTLDSSTVSGGVWPLLNQRFYRGMNDWMGKDPTGAAFDPNAFKLYTSWSKENGTSTMAKARTSVARGEDIFNNFPLFIYSVAGLNDVSGQSVIMGTCSTCHDAPNVGSISRNLPMDIGVSDALQRTPDMPLYTFLCKSTGVTVQTTDPGRALITGKCADMSKFKSPGLRALASHAPYFHNGMAKDLGAVIDFYNARFDMNLSDQQRADLIAFLRTL
jgi:cytochrome c peroxidase